MVTREDELSIHRPAPAGKNFSIVCTLLQVQTRSRSAVRYDIVGGNGDAAFAMNPGSGIMVTRQYLDFERRRFYNLTVEASNMAGRRDRCTVNVHVLDVNDNAPVFERRYNMNMT